ncbi:CIC11C00000000930 [Sungouiella intermedia]|uniref:Carboxypeptidase n=1 Tax=Sungouiella intermedia TaxID=45354 RepID=A0A1L0DEE9_9ASCO|nr:CIC11C00000002783 [[Candida] intermedia]SGZ54288.1 CIC11C00000000930 [[Candida] intermedia]
MRLTTVATIACAASSANALTIPSFGHNLQGVQQILSDKVDVVSSQYSQIVQALESKKGDVLAKIAQYFNEPLENISKETKNVWLDMFTSFPDTIAAMNFKSNPKKATKNKATFDFHVTDAKLPNHKLRVKATPEDLGIDKVKQYTGYLDVEDEDKHFFYWFFESRGDPKKDPVILWLNGGPGCSSLTGLFFELGPSSINKSLKPVYNPSSWNSNANVIFLDQPVNVGFSYSSGSVTNTVAAGQDVYAFLELFFKQFPEYKKQDFHIAGESYGGHYIPVFSSEILSHPERSFNLTSVLIGNGLTDPLTQYEYYQPMACGEGGEPSVLEPEECDNMADSIPRCLSLIESCYNSGSVWSCVPATIYCNNAQMGPYQKTGRNVYDIRTMCEGSSLCYKELLYIDDYLNLPEVKAKLGVEVEEYQSCNFDVNRNFMFAGDWMKPYHKNVIDILEAGVPVLIYAGDKDFICNWLGNQAWADRLPWSGHKKFEAEPIRTWTVNKEAAGEVKNYKHFTFLRVFGGGHMVPYDQPENALEMVNRWVSGDFAYN